MSTGWRAVFSVVALVTLATFALLPEIKTDAQLPEYSGGINVFGLVDHQLNLTDADLLSLPMVSEIAILECVWSDIPGSPSTITVNWTGIPLFHILTIAATRPEAFKVVFRTRPPDSFFDTLRIEDALDPRTILAVKANGTLLTTVSEISTGHIGGYRLVVPGRWGYKWVANVGSIEVVDYEILGTYETSLHQSDEALIQDAPMTFISPPLQTFNLTFGNRTSQFEAFTNISITQFEFNLAQNRFDLNVSIPSNSIGFADFIIPQDILKGPYIILVGSMNADAREANMTDKVFEYTTFSEGTHAVNIVGTEFTGTIPTIVIESIGQLVHTDEIVVFNASRSVDDGTIVSYDWDFGDGTRALGMIVSHAYTQEGTYQVRVNVKDNDGLSNFKVFAVTVERTPLDIALIIKIGLSVSIVLLAIVFAFLMTRRRSHSDTL